MLVSRNKQGLTVTHRSTTTERLGILYRDEFDRFSPLTTPVDKRICGGGLVSVARRARTYLRNLTDQEIVAIAQLSDEWVSEYAFTGCVHALSLRSTRAFGISPATIRECSDTELVAILSAFVSRQGTKALGLVNGFPNVKVDPIRLNATQALVQCARALEANAEREQDKAGLYAMRAAELVALAWRYMHETANDPADPAEIVREALSRQNSSAAEARWSKLLPIKSEAIEIYRSRRKEWRSRADAVRHIQRVLREKAKKCGLGLAPKTVDAWLKASD